MHSYACECSSRKWGNSIIAFVSLLLLVVLTEISNKIQLYTPNFPANEYTLVLLLMPSVGFMSIFSIVHRIYKCCVWKFFSGMPNLNGTWIGIVRIRHDDDNIERDFCVNCFQQNWLDVRIDFETDRTSSKSEFAVLSSVNQHECEFKYGYFCEPKMIENTKITSHHGMASMLFTRETIKGEFYTNTRGGGCGDVLLIKVSPDKLEFDNAKELYTQKYKDHPFLSKRSRQNSISRRTTEPESRAN